MSNWLSDKSRYYDKYGREGKCNIILDQGVGKIVRDAIRNARKRILVVSPWIGRGYAKMLIEKALEGVEVYIITSGEENNMGKSILSMAGRHGEELRRAEENLKRAEEERKRAEEDLERAKKRAEAAATRAEKRSARLAMVRNMTLAAIAAVLASIALPYANHLYAVIGLWAALIVNPLYAVIGLSPVLIVIFYHRGKQKIEQIDARAEEDLERAEEELRRAEEDLERAEERAEEELKTVDEKLVKAAKSVRALKNLRVLIYNDKLIYKERVVLIHAKLYIVDERAWIGSVNLTRAGVYEYYELLAEIDAEVVEEMFMDLWARLSSS